MPCMPVKVFNPIQACIIIGPTIGSQFDCPGRRKATFGIPIGKLEPKCNRLGVNAVSSSDHGRVLKFPRPTFEDFRQSLEISRNDFRRLGNQQGLSGVHDIV